MLQLAWNQIWVAGYYMFAAFKTCPYNFISFEVVREDMEQDLKFQILYTVADYQTKLQHSKL